MAYSQYGRQLTCDVTNTADDINVFASDGYHMAGNLKIGGGGEIRLREIGAERERERESNFHPKIVPKLAMTNPSLIRLPCLT